MLSNPSKRRKNAHAAFMLLDAVMGLCVCAVGFSLTFGFLFLLSPTPKPKTANAYKQILDSPPHATIELSTHSAPMLTYSVDEYKHDDGTEVLYYFAPKAIK